MLFIFLSIFSGIAAGWLLRSKPRFARGAERLLQPVIYALLFTMGISVGADRQVIAGLTGLGLDAAIITLGALTGSLLAAKGVYLRFFRNRANRPAREPACPDIATTQTEITDPVPASNGWGSAKVILAFLIGAGIGYCLLQFMPDTTTGQTLPIPQGDALAANSGTEPNTAIGLVHMASRISHWVLYLLIFLVGITLGNDGSILRQLRGQGASILLAPAATILGTLAGVALFSLLLPHLTTAECLMVGSGFGYYSLSSILITQSSGAVLGATSLVSNILRELAALGLAPWMARRFGPLAPISAGGATTMDTTLPVIARVSGKNFIFVAIIHGIVVDFSVPVLVTLFSMF